MTLSDNRLFTIGGETDTSDAQANQFVIILLYHTSPLFSAEMLSFLDSFS